MSGKYIRKKTRKTIVERAFERCEYCQSWMRNAIHPFNIDHIIPIDKGGGSEMENLALSCGGCNSFKANKIAAKDPVTNEMAPLYHPRTDEWEEHFAWSDDYLEIIGLTPTGRATIETLKLNRPGLVNIRRLPKMTGEHPHSNE